MRRAATIAGRGIWGQLGNGRPLTVGDGGRVGGRHPLDDLYADSEAYKMDLRRSLVPHAISVQPAPRCPAAPGLKQKGWQFGAVSVFCVFVRTRAGRGERAWRQAPFR
jgi:hypothetical protein